MDLCLGSTHLLFFCSDVYSDSPYSSEKIATDALRYQNDVLLLDQECVLSLPAWKKLMKTGGGRRTDGLNSFFSFFGTWNSDGRCACTCHAQMYLNSCSPPLCSLNLGNMQENAWQWKEHFNLSFLWIPWPKRSSYYIHCSISLPPSESFCLPKVGSRTVHRLNPLSSRAFLLSGKGPTTSSPAKII